MKNPQLKKAYATDEYTPNMIQELAKCKKPTKNKDRIYDTRPRYFTYMYADILSGNPFYIGKGCGKRHLDHLSSKKTELVLIQHIMDIGKKNISVTKIVDAVDEEFALFVEEELIAKYGRMDLGTGPLLNKTSGGMRL